MPRRLTDPPDRKTLHRLAERTLKRQPVADSIASDDPQHLIHELRVHQVELEMQNEALIELRTVTEEALARYTALYDFAPVGYVTLNRAGVIERANRLALSLLGMPPNQIGQNRLRDFIADPFHDDLARFLLSLPDKRGIERCEVTLTPATAQPGASVILEGNGGEPGYGDNVALIDITARRASEQLLAERSQELQRMNQALSISLAELIEARKSMEIMAMHDQLTGLANRHKFLQTYAIEVERHNRTMHPLSLLVIDVDYFKTVNDRLGHLAGDACLRALATLMERNVRAADLIGRFGGEEFVILLPDSDADGAVAAAENLRDEITRTKLDVGPEGLLLTVSIGTATLEAGQPIDFDRLMRRADRALYRAKSAGRNRVAMSSDADDTDDPLQPAP
ncbi:sensor domain-containing diguanylate cyclase [Magnetospirillum fulvum]|uniref:diguanylate cyclase n=1 Tax=Magnetospirillum fulvum MGU-K5 TaxID=1316936 RepID=S9S4A3_MAGFU|nr:sensor domain-containing diguanylate cyclase [Magnetospirillum fulvum]EPY00772.1 diguanylate cyclase/phosphodiesterase with PAS/PAC sensor [Magnetospirillum fulvum MGU-K5]